LAKVKLGINNCFAAKRWPEPEEWSRIIVEEFGLEVVQFSFDLADPLLSKSVRPRISQDIAKVTSNFGITICSTFTGLSFYSFNQLLHPNPRIRERALRFCEEAILMTGEMNVKATGGPLGSLSFKDFHDPSRKEYLTDCLIESIQYLSEIASSLGQKFLLWEPTPISRELTETREKARKFYERVNKRAKVPVLFCLDVGHQCLRSGLKEDKDPYVWVKEFAHISPVIHIQQTDGVYDRHWPFTDEYNRKGIIKPEKLIETIENSKAEEVILILEIIHPFEEDENKVLSDLKESVDFWKRKLAG